MKAFYLQRSAFTRPGILISLVLLISSCKRTQPMEIHTDLAGKRIVEHLRGPQAKQMINHLHGKGVTPQENEVVFYEGAKNKGTLYLSRYSDGSEADSMVEEMARRIRNGNPVFTDYEEFSLDGEQVSRCLGMGQMHYFFVRDDQMYWLSADTQVAQQALNDLLR